MDDRIKTLQLKALDNIGGFLADLEHTTDAYEAERLTYTIMRNAESIHKSMHEVNAFHGSNFCERMIETIPPCVDPAVLSARAVELRIKDEIEIVKHNG